MIIKTGTGKIFIYNKDNKIRIQSKCDDLLFKDIWFDDEGKLISSHSKKLFSKNGMPIAIELLIGNETESIRFLVIVNKASYMRSKTEMLDIIDDKDMEIVDINEEEIIEVLI